MSEELSIEQTTQLLQVKRELERINHQALQLRQSPLLRLSRAEMDQMASILEEAATRIGSSVLALVGISDQVQQMEDMDIELPAFMNPYPQATE